MIWLNEPLYPPVSCIVSMKDVIDLSPGMLRALISDYLSTHSDEIADDIMDCFFANAVVMNSDRDNDGAGIRLCLEIPPSGECRRLLDSGEIDSVRCPGI